MVSAVPRHWLLPMALLAVVGSGWTIHTLRRLFARCGQGSRDTRAPKSQQRGQPSDGVKPSHMNQVRGIAAFVKGVAAVAPMLSEEAARGMYPRHFELHDHVVVVKMNEGVSLESFSNAIARVFAESFLPRVVDVVIADTNGIGGELRQPIHRVLFCGEHPHSTQKRLLNKVVGKRFKGRTVYGDAIGEEEAKVFEAVASSPTFTVHVENGVKYCFDVMRVMFCSGNTTERMHFAAVSARDETVVDMFAGIGYFTLPLSMHGHPRRVVALEKNPISCTLLRFNTLLNGTGDVVEVHQGDNREATGSDYVGKCNRVLMGYIPSCKEFLPRAYSFLKRCESPSLPDGGAAIGVVHYHFLAGERAEAMQCAAAHVVEELGEAVIDCFEIAALRQVKSYAPRVWHYVADVVFRPPPS